MKKSSLYSKYDFCLVTMRKNAQYNTSYLIRKVALKRIKLIFW